MIAVVGVGVGVGVDSVVGCRAAKSIENEPIQIGPEANL